MAFACATASGSAGAASELPDPTRPPAIPAAGPGDADAQATIAELQSVLISPQRRIAIVNGRAVQVGDRVGEAKVVKISENEVVLRNGQDTRVLKIFPHIEKRMVRERTGTPGRTGAK